MENTDSEFFPETETDSTTSYNSIPMTRIESIDEVTIEYGKVYTEEYDSEMEISSLDSDINTEEDTDNEYVCITEDDFTELTTTTYDIMDDYVKHNILSLSSPKFYNNMIMYVAEVLYTDVLYSININDETDKNYEELLFNEIKEFIEETTDIFLDICDIPRRSFVQKDDEIKTMTENDIFIMTEKLAVLQCVPQPEQKTSEWYTFRYNLITASNLWKVFGTKSQVNNLIYEKCKPLDTLLHIRNNEYTEGAMHWGVKYEPVTIQVYEDMYNTKVGEFGCIPHSKYSYIGASPDGINISPDNKRFGRMVEIKNIVNRDITGIPKEEYWIQTQIQMETCDLDECDFVETRFKEYDTEEKFYMDTQHEYRGLILHFIERPPSIINEETQLSNKPYYVYMPLNIPLQQDDVNTWIKSQKTNMYQDNRVLFSVKYWYLDEISCVCIQRNRVWFSNAVPHIQEVWDTIVRERVEGYEHRASKKRQMNDRSMSIVSDDDIQNNVFTKVENPICLIKLDDNGNVL